MKVFNKLKGLCVPLDRPNVDTDAIIPKQFLKSIKRTGFGPYLFDEWRYQDHGEPDQDCTNRPLREDFVLNQARYQGAEILLARENFGCGSSREHAVWALDNYGIRCIIASSFADIFYSNCGKNGLLAITLDVKQVDHLFKVASATPGYQLQIDLEQQTITTPEGKSITFNIDGGLKKRLLQGLDDIELTLQYSEEIKAYEQRRAKEVPWLFSDK